MKRRAVNRNLPDATNDARPKLAAREVRVAKSGLLILGGVDLEVAPGSFVAPIGPSEAGKSTLLQVLAEAYVD